ncbi:efflux RND transporter permease subunit [Actinoplanes sp. NPDC026623]|uniref:efflux RND transporter permease subunit n=1 Tax=Actinoplanes sp. NPDC026623 TaxID=3155610 RepID=UPI0033E65D41
MSFLTRLSLANRGLVALVAVVITAFGIFTVPSLKQQLLPSLEFPGAFIGVVLPGASPEIMEQQVTKPIEDAIKGADGLDSIQSTTSEGSTTVQVLFEFGTDLDDAVNQLTTSVNRIQPTLPNDVKPVIFAGSTDDIPAIVLAASDGKNDQAALANRLRETVVPELKAIDGVREVAVTGTRDQQVLIVPEPVKMVAAGVDPRSIATLLQANGVSVPAGAVTDGTRSLSVQVGEPIESVDEIKGLYLTGSKGPVRLDAVAAVNAQLAPATSYTRTDGVESLGIAVTAAPDGNPVNISHEVRDKLADLQTASAATLTVITDQAPFVEKSIKSLTTEGMLGLIMAVIVILVFLLSVRSTLVTIVSIPLSVLIALIALKLGDHSLNLLTLGALTIAVGRVVDDSIVVLENIKRHLEYGEAKVHAIMSGVKEVSGAVTASTLTTVAVFAPIALVGGFVGQLFAPFAITVTVALVASLFVSLTVVPVLAYWFLRPAAGGSESVEVRQAAEAKELRSPLQRSYLPIIRWVIRSRTTRWSTVGIGVVVLLGTMGLASKLETNFLDQSGQDTIVVSQDLPVGTDLATTDAAAKKVEAVIVANDDVEHYQVTVGNGDFNPFVGSGGASGASFNVALKADADAAKVSEDLRKQFEGMTDVGEVTIGAESGTGFDGSALAVVVQAPDQKALEAATKQVQDAMAATPDVTDVSSTLAASVPRLDVTVDRAAAAANGLTEAAIGRSVAGAFRPAPVGEISVDGVSQNVLVALGKPPAGVDALRKLPLTTPSGQVVLLDAVADVNEVDGPEAVTRIDGNRSATVNGTATGSNVGKTTKDLTERLDALNLPDGTYEIGGVSQDQKDAFADLGLAVLAAIAIVFFIMVATFRSLLQPLLLLVSIPFAATGAIALLLATGTPLGVPALIGVLMLVGIVVTNAIVLMDLINHYRRAGLGVQESVIEGGRHRLRPILMTAIATIFALLPMALGLTGEGGFISQPLAIVVIGGLVSSTLLTLVLVPTLYTMAENTKVNGRRRRENRRARKAAKAGGAAGVNPESPRHAAAEPGVVVPADDPVPASSGGAHAAAEGATARSEPAAPSAALHGYTDQFEVLKMPRRPADPPTA